MQNDAITNRRLDRTDELNGNIIFICPLFSLQKKKKNNLHHDTNQIVCKNAVIEVDKSTCLSQTSRCRIKNKEKCRNIKIA